MAAWYIQYIPMQVTGFHNNASLKITEKLAVYNRIWEPRYYCMKPHLCRQWPCSF